MNNELEKKVILHLTTQLLAHLQLSNIFSSSFHRFYLCIICGSKDLINPADITQPAVKSARIDYLAEKLSNPVPPSEVVRVDGITFTRQTSIHVSFRTNSESFLESYIFPNP